MTCDALNLARFHLGDSVNQMCEVAHQTNNKVFTFSADGGKYIFKFYKSKYWPETGKLDFVYRTLRKNNIPCAEVKVFSRDNVNFPNGYLIEQLLPGTSADKVSLDRDSRAGMFEKLGSFMSNVHSIRLEKFGYIGTGEPYEDSMCSFFEDEFDERANSLIEKGIFKQSDIELLKNKFFAVLRNFNDLPAVLCHGDLADKNVLMQHDGSIVLIDWDDAMAYCWMADVSRFTFSLKVKFSEEDVALYRNAFLSGYESDLRKDDFPVFEEGFHIYLAVDFLSYYLKTDNTEMQDRIIKYLRDRL